MSILVIDQVSQRKAAIEQALLHAGLLLTERFHSNSFNLLEKISHSRMVVLLDSTAPIEWNNPTWQVVLKDKMLIGPKALITDKPVKEALECPVKSPDNTEQFTAGLLKLVTHTFYRFFFPITVDERMQAMLAIARKAAKSSASILIEGETGSGKEMLAQYIHHHSTYINGPFIAVNCAAIPETMIEAVLFGYEKGAFTNAINTHIGKFEQANGGTLFLDEIAEMSTELQAKLLRVLQQNEFERIGGRETLKVDVRIIAATNQDLKKQMLNSQFRPDLYYRLNVVNLKCLPLRQRVNDINALAQYFVQLYAQELDKRECRIDKTAMDMLKKYEWPGNIRELQNVIHRAVIMDDDNNIDIQDLGSFSTLNQQNESSSLRTKEAETIVNVLKEANGCRKDAAKRLMISPRTLRHKIAKLKDIGLEVP